MCCAVAEVGETAGRTDNLNIKVCCAKALTDLFEASAASEHSERVCEGDLAREAETCSKGSHVLFCDAHFKVSFRESLFHEITESRAAEVSFQRNDIFICFCKFDDLFAVSLS